MAILAQISLAPWRAVLRRLRACWALTKALQTGLLLSTGLAGYVSARAAERSWPALACLGGSLYLAISGCTVLNMVYDRDIDAKMARTASRPLPRQLVRPGEAAALGFGLAGLGVAWGLYPGWLYGLVVIAGLFFDLVVYTVWLKRRTPWSIAWGGVAGGVPVLAGRALALGRIDPIGVLLALAVLLWIPTHVLSFSLRHAGSYREAGLPVLPNTHGEQATRLILALSTGGAAAVMTLVAWQIGLSPCPVATVGALGLGLAGIALGSVLCPSRRLDLVLFKLASVYMLCTMMLIVVGV